MYRCLISPAAFEEENSHKYIGMTTEIHNSSFSVKELVFPTCLVDQPRCLGLKNLMLKKLLLSVYQRQVDTSGICDRL